MRRKPHASKSQPYDDDVHVSARPASERQGRERTKSDDGREVGEARVADALRDGEAGNGDAGDEVGLEGAERVGGRPLQEREEVPERSRRAPPGAALPHHGPERVVREEGLLEVGAERVQERARLRQRHPQVGPLIASVLPAGCRLGRVAAHGRRVLLAELSLVWACVAGSLRSEFVLQAVLRWCVYIQPSRVGLGVCLMRVWARSA
jgi:hypothetical protein